MLIMCIGIIGFFGFWTSLYHNNISYLRLKVSRMMDKSVCNEWGIISLQSMADYSL